MKGKNKMKNEVYTENLAEFGSREIIEAMELLDAINRSGLPEQFETEGVRIGFNKNSGLVFLTNNEYQTCISTTKEDGTGIDLFMFYTTSYSGLDGSIEDLIEQWEDMHLEDKEEVIELARQEKKLDLIPDNIIEQLEGL